MTDINLRPLEATDYLKITDLDLREVDKGEIKASTGRPPSIVLEESLMISEDVHIIENPDNGEILGVFGVAEVDEKSGAVWMLTEGEYGNHSIKIFRYVKKCIEKWEEDYDILFNFIDARRSGDFKFLETLGFTVDTEHEYYFRSDDYPFYRFWKINDERGD